MILETMLGTVIGYLTNSLKSTKGGKSASDELSMSIWEWIKPLFLKEEEKEVLTEFKRNPDDEQKKAMVEAMLKKYLEGDDKLKEELKDYYEKLPNTGGTTRIVEQTGPKSFYIERNDGDINVS